MKKPWSISTTVRNPERLRNLLIVLQQLENLKWDTENQEKYQILLIKNRIYGYGEPQFYKNLSKDKIDLVDDISRDISFDEAREIFSLKNYKSPDMRGRQSINPLKKFGLVVIDNKRIKITNLGKLFFKEDFDFEEIFFRSFLKWQIPNPDSRDYPKNGDYNIKPFIGVLHLIDSVNKKEINRGNKPKGISKNEFSLFAPTLVHYENIDNYADKIILLRDKMKLVEKTKQREIFEEYKKAFVIDFLGANNKSNVNKLLKNLKDYGDNAIRYFRLTRYLIIRGGGFYIDLEPRRTIEINSLLANDNAQAKHFDSRIDYLSYISDNSQPQLPWESKEKYFEIVEELIFDIRRHEKELSLDNIQISQYIEMSDNELKNYISNLRGYRQSLQERENHKKSQTSEQIKSYIKGFENIFNSENKPILLEKLSALGLHALNDALKIQPNYPVGDDNEPTYTAPAGIPDIECFYNNFNSICEVTMLTGRDQWYNEGQPVMRHLRDFEKKHEEKPAYCLFIAPKIHRDTVNTFWNAIKYEYEGKIQKIIPFSIDQFVSILQILLQIKNEKKFLKHTEISRLFDEILQSSRDCNNSVDWINGITAIISLWGKSFIS